MGLVGGEQPPISGAFKAVFLLVATHRVSRAVPVKAAIPIMSAMGCSLGRCGPVFEIHNGGPGRDRLPRQYLAGYATWPRLWTPATDDQTIIPGLRRAWK